MRNLYSYLFILIFLWACNKDSTKSNPIPLIITDGANSVHLLLGNPTSANNDPVKDFNYLILRDEYASSYNSSIGIPNWTAWHLGKSDLGSAVRKDDFRPDDSLPDGFRRISPTEYTSEYGFDRGHMCPSADRTSSAKANSSTFLMTNIVPQAPELNRGLWEEFEAYCREQVYNGNEVYIYSGGYGLFGNGANGTFRDIASGRVNVPGQYYKVVLILPEGENDISRINENTVTIAIDVPNHQSTKNKNWEDFIVPVFNVEVSAKIKFWSNIPIAISEKLRYKKFSLNPTTTTPAPPSTPSSGCGVYNGKKVYRGPEGGCYYINSNGNKTYVDRSYCNC